MRLLTRSDFDGLACGTILEYLNIIDDYKYVHPKDVQDNLIEVTKNDILANIPYIAGCGIWFDHHSSESERKGFDFEFEGESRLEKSCARILYEYYGGDKKLSNFKEMIHFVDKVDSGDLTKDEILNPKGWILLGFLMDPRTGLGRFKNFRISNYQLMEKLMSDCAHKNINEILEDEDIKERIEIYKLQDEKFKDMIIKHTKTVGDAIVTDLRGLDTIYTGNRFLIYSLFPNQNISLWIVDGKNQENVSVAVGYSILNRTSNIDVGNLLLKHGGGGHKNVGTCQVAYNMADETINKILDSINN